MSDKWPGFNVARFGGESDAEFNARSRRIKEIVLTFRHRYYTRQEATALERELERLEDAPMRANAH